MSPCAALLPGSRHIHWCKKGDLHRGPHQCAHARCRFAWATRRTHILRLATWRARQVVTR